MEIATTWYNGVGGIQVKEQTCCFTGHRTIPEWQQDNISVALRVTIRNLIHNGYRYFGVGGALGFDTMAAQMVLSLKTEFPAIKLILVLPCKNQTDKWGKKDRAIYEKIKGQADKVVYITEYYTPDCMMRRNRHLVDHSSVCVCYLTQKQGGTVYTVNYAHRKGVRVINLVQKQ